MKATCAPVAFVLLLAMTGCGGSKPPPFAIACATHRLPSGVFSSRVTVTNQTAVAGRAIVFGPALFWTRYVHPVVPGAEVAVLLPGGRRSTYIGFQLPSIKPGGKGRILFRLGPRARFTHIAVTDRAIIHSKDLSLLRDGACRVAGAR